MAKVTRLPLPPGKAEAPHALERDSLAPWGEARGPAHLVQFYENDTFLLDVVTRFIGDALRAGDSAIAIATKTHCDELERRLGSEQLDLAALRARGRFICADASASLSRFMIDGVPDRSRFLQFVGSILERAAASSQTGHVRAFGEMVALLCLDGKTEAAVRLESLWNELAGYRQFSLLCGYPISLFSGDEHGTPLEEICNAHSWVAPTERYAKLAGAGARARSVIRLQHKAEALRVANERLQQAEQTLERQREELSDLLENAIEGLYEIGADGTIRWANRALLTLLGWRADEYVGRHVAFFYADRREFDQFWTKVMSGEPIHDEPAHLRCRDGSPKHVRVHATSVWNDGAFERVRCFVRDVTEHRQLEQELKARLEQLAEADRRKDEFLAMLGHELRNPLSAIRNAVATASLDASRRARALEIARRQSDQLGRLIDDLLDVARITQGRITLQKEPLYFASVVERAVECSRAIIEERGHRLQVSLAPELIRLQGDAARLEQIIVNLLTNASKYTEPGGRIELSCERELDNAVLRVRDTGMGIAPEVLPRIFDLFAQGERGPDRAQGGLGVGLTITRRLVELHGGRIEAHSAGLGCGAEFVMRLPIMTEEQDDEDPVSRIGAPRRSARVLIVEDNLDAGESLMMLLELLGHHVRVLSAGLTAIDAARANVPDVMLVDIGLPDVDGYEVARRVRADAALRDIVLVALTGYGRPEDKREAIAAGFDYHIVKPVSIDALQDLVTRLAGNSSRFTQPS